MARPVDNPQNPWSQTRVDFEGDAPDARLKIIQDSPRSILSKNTSPDIPFTWSVNPYRGCFHGCIYCYARPSHQYLGLGAGTDFERTLVVKPNAAALLQEAFDRPSWTGDSICFSGNTDCYQPLEKSWRLTQGCLEVCLAYRNPVSIITKGALIQRDVELLARLHAAASVHVFISITSLQDEVSRVIEPNASSPATRLQSMRLLAAAGIPVGVSVSPVIPGLTDGELAPILAAAKDAGARAAFFIPLRLPAEVLPVFTERIQSQFSPERARHILSAQRDIRAGQLNTAGFGARMQGSGARWEVLQSLFRQSCRRLGLSQEHGMPRANTFRRPRAQGELFELPPSTRTAPT